MFNEYPYKNLEDLNLDYLLKKMRELEKTLNIFVGANTLTFADPITWSISTQYAKNVIVLSNSGDAYLSKQAVPAGVQLNNADYWQEIFNFADYVRTANENLTVNVEQNTTRASQAYNVGDWLLWNDVLYKVIAAIAADDLLIENTNVEHFTVEDFIKAWITYANGLIVQYKNDIDASEYAYKNEMQAEVDRILAGATVDSEVIDARLGWNGTNYTTLGNALRGQIGLLAGENYVSTVNYSTALPDADNAPEGSVYLLNFADNAARSANLPDMNQVAMGALITLGHTPIPTQYYIGNYTVYRRFYSGGAWGAWVLISGGVTVTQSNFATTLADLNDANSNTIYVLNFGASDSKPANVPDSSVAYGISLLITEGSFYKAQYLIDKKFIYRRLKANNVWSAWELVTDFNTAYINQGKCITSSNYSVDLPDLDSQPSNSIYILNFAAASSKPANIPDNSKAYTMSMLMYYDYAPYPVQYLIDPNFTYFRFKISGVWQSWTLATDFNTNFINTGLEITSSNYSTALPDLDNQPSNSIYILNFAANASKPANVPDNSIGYSLARLIYLDYGPYPCQYLIDPDYEFYRFKVAGIWQDWKLVKSPNVIKANPNNLIATLKKWNGSNKTIILDNGVYDTYQMYIDYYGNDFWTNYQNYDDVTDPFYKGVYLENINIIGSGNSKFTFSGATNATIDQYFALIAPAGKVSMSNIICDNGNHKLRYAVHDDFEPLTNQYGTKIEYHNCVFLGSSSQKCAIGAGFRNNGSYVIDNCVFDGIDNTYDISYHSHVLGSVPSQIVISNCLGTSLCSFGYYGAGTEMNTCIVNNCQFKEISKRAVGGAMYDNMNLIKYLCVETN